MALVQLVVRHTLVAATYHAEHAIPGRGVRVRHGTRGMVSQASEACHEGFEWTQAELHTLGFRVDCVVD